jgi:hypothetical protein
MCSDPPTLQTSSASPRANHLGASQSNDATRILPPSSRLSANVVLSVVPNFSSVFSTKNPQLYSNYCFSVMSPWTLRRSALTPSDGDGRRVEMHMMRAEYEQRLREIEARVAAQKPEDKKHRELIVQLIDAGYRAMAKTLHPDMRRSHEDMTRLSTVRDELRRRID